MCIFWPIFITLRAAVSEFFDERFIVRCSENILTYFFTFSKGYNNDFKKVIFKEVEILSNELTLKNRNRQRHRKKVGSYF